MFKTHPIVFAVGNNYQIMIQTKRPCLFSVQVGEEEYFDASNGIMCSLSEIHRVTVPMEQLNNAKGYTLRVRPLIERKPYFTKTEPLEEYPYNFSPLPQGKVRLYHISDAHNRIDEPIRAARTFGDFDMLILNGDILSHCGDAEKFDNVYEIASQLTQGQKPVLFSRGNHDMRGIFAEKFAEYTPNDHGNTYYSFRLGSIWGVCLDCAEDKPDDNAEYGYTVSCHAFRRNQTQMLKDIIARKKEEYQADGITTKVVVCHVPFSFVNRPPFDIEQEVYTEWCRLLQQEIQPDVMICGHTHRTEIWRQGGPRDHLGQPCPVVIGGRPAENYFAGCGYEIDGKEITVTFTDSNGDVLSTETL